MGMTYDSEADGVEEDYAKGFNASPPKESPGLLKQAGMGLARGFLRNVKGFGIAVAPMTTFNEEDRASWAENFDFLDKAIEKVTPDPHSVGLAGRLVGAVSELPGQLVMGPAGLINSVVMNTGADLVDQGVEAKTATAAAIGTGLVTGAMMMVPGAGKTVKATVGAVAVQPVLGAGQRGATKLYLENQGYDEQAKMFDPLDPKSIITDTALSAVFGVLGHGAHPAERIPAATAGRPKEAAGAPLPESTGGAVEFGSPSEQLRGKLPVKVEDSLDTFANHQKVRRATPFDEGAVPGMADVHLEAHDKALDDVLQGRPVDVVPILQAAGENLASGAEESGVARARALQIHPQAEAITDPEVISDPGVGAEGLSLQDFLKKKGDALSSERSGYSQLSRDDLHLEYERLAQEEQTLEERVLGKSLDAWRKAQRQLNSRDDARVAAAEAEIARIESQLPGADAKKLYGEGEVGHSADDVREYVNAIDAIGGDTPGELAQSLKFAATKINGKSDPEGMNSAEFSAYLQLREGMHLAAEKGWDTQALSDDVIKAAASRFADPADALYMLQGFLKKNATPDPAQNGLDGLPYRQHQPDEEAQAQRLMRKELADLGGERKVETQFVAEGGAEPASANTNAHSKVLAEMERLPQEKWSGPELLANLRKAAGKDEVALTGLDKFLAGKNRVSKEDVRAFLSDNQGRVADAFKVQLRESSIDENSPAWHDLVGKFESGERIRSIDPMTGFLTRAEFDLAKPHIWARVQKARQGAYTEFDIANAGGMNENIGEFHTDRVITDIAEIVQRTFQEHGITDVQLFRNSGDELQVVSLSSPEAQAKAAQAAQMKVAEYVQENGLQDAYGRTSPGMPKNTTKAGTGLYQATVDIYGHASMSDAVDRARIMVNREKINAKEAARGQELSQGTRTAASGEQPGTAGRIGSEGAGDRSPAPGTGNEPHGGSQGHGVDEASPAHSGGDPLPMEPLSLSKDPLGYDVETILAERGDMVMVADVDARGNPTAVASARQLIAEAQADIERTQRSEDAYKRAAHCLGLG